MIKQRIAVGISGGVDSSVSALLLKQQDHDVIGVFMKNWNEDDEAGYCPAAQDLLDAQSVCQKIGIELHTVSFADEYWDRVFDYFLQEYQAGRTPNPDILCNREIKFKAFLDYAQTLDAEMIAMGHYARTAKNPQGQSLLLKGLDHNKDQSYFLHAISQQALAKSIFPIGELEKSQVRKIAEDNGLITHNKKDSTGICFIGERKFKDFLQTYLPAQPGDIVTPEGKIIGQHDGLMYHTIGQRQGLNIGGLKSGSGEPWYVADKDLVQNQLIVVQGSDHPLLFKSKLNTEQLTWIVGHAPASPETAFTCTAKIRYRQADQPCTVTLHANHTASVVFDEPQRAVTPGQSIVFYHQDVCLGGGIIA